MGQKKKYLFYRCLLRQNADFIPDGARKEALILKDRKDKRKKLEEICQNHPCQILHSRAFPADNKQRQHRTGGNKN